MKLLEKNSQVLIQGASRGIGFEFVKQLVKHQNIGFVHATCRQPKEALLLKDLASKHPNKIKLHVIDVTNEQTICSAAENVSTISKNLHLLVNCTGILHDAQIFPEKRLQDICPESLTKSFQINAFGPVLIAKHFQSLFHHKQPAIFANISARVGSITDNRLGGWYAYRGSKAAQNMLTKTIALEFKRTAKTTICVALHPGTVATDLSSPFTKNIQAQKLFTPQQSVNYLLEVMNSLEMSDSGSFFAWDGQKIPW
ncbi:SDR family oxidoreductase [Candidatus Uabimicrobium sp. HlEnr_7]|uniref:SDR family oxidoreductase n=1 Tax=Candidatus Uabimicrobium helgolandensis TaxID=3095367 RepID=UPI00355864F2